MGADLEVNKIYSFKGKEVEKNNSCTTKSWHMCIMLNRRSI